LKVWCHLGEKLFVIFSNGDFKDCGITDAFLLWEDKTVTELCLALQDVGVWCGHPKKAKQYVTSTKQETKQTFLHLKKYPVSLNYM